MLARAVQSYLALRRAAGFQLKDADCHLNSFASYSDARRRGYIDAHTAIEWARRGRSVVQRARRLSHVIRFARHLHAEDPRHEIPPAVFGTEHFPRRPPYILTNEQIRELIEEASKCGYPTLRRQCLRVRIR